MDLNNLLRELEVELSNGESITVRELSYKGYCEMRQASQEGDQARAGALTVWYGVPEFQKDYTVEDVAELLPLVLLDEITGHIMELSGALLDAEDIAGNSDAEQSAA